MGVDCQTKADTGDVVTIKKKTKDTSLLVSINSLDKLPLVLPLGK